MRRRAYLKHVATVRSYWKRPCMPTLHKSLPPATLHAHSSNHGRLTAHTPSTFVRDNHTKSLPGHMCIIDQHCRPQKRKKKEKKKRKLIPNRHPHPHRAFGAMGVPRGKGGRPYRTSTMPVAEWEASRSWKQRQA